MKWCQLGGDCIKPLQREKAALTTNVTRPANIHISKNQEGPRKSGEPNRTQYKKNARCHSPGKVQEDPTLFAMLLESQSRPSYKPSPEVAQVL
jgi:hypothetical protein